MTYQSSWLAELEQAGVSVSPTLRAALTVRDDFLVGKQKELLPGDVQGFRKQLLDFISQQGLGTVLGGADQGPDLAPFQELFRQRREVGLAQAKESAGTLTGSGFANILGSAAGRSISEENAFLAQLMESARQQSANRFLGLIGQVPGFVGQQGHQPGFLDFLFQGAQAAAPLVAAASSLRFKEDIEDAPDLSEELDKLLELRPISFNYRKPWRDSSDELQYGLIAEEVEAVLPKLVHHDLAGRPDGIYYSRLCVMLLNKLRELAMVEAT